MLTLKILPFKFERNTVSVGSRESQIEKGKRQNSASGLAWRKEIPREASSKQTGGKGY
jgi:hypothetical protein